MYSERNINEIIAKHFLDELTVEEQVILDEWLLKDDNKEFFDTISAEGFMGEELARLDYFNNRVDRNNELVWNKINESSQPVNVRNQWPFKLTAACIALCLVAGFYFWFTTRGTKSKEAIPNNNKVAIEQNDVPPGKYKATLQLADGRNIVLDSIGNVQIAQQGGTTIINNTDGHIVYNVTDKVNTADRMLYNTLRTEKGQTYSVVLPDGSRVWLNAASTINYPVAFNDKERRVKITGEAYFEIKSLLRDLAGKIPFIVIVQDSAGNTCEEVEVLGTQFNINAYKEENKITTTLLEGKVKIKKEKNIILSEPNQQSVLSKTTGDIAIVRNVNIEGIVAWKNNYFYFDRDSLATVIKQVARWYDVYFVIDKRLSNKTFSGRIMRNMPLSKVLEKVEMTSGVQFTIHQGKRSFTISPKPKP